MKRRIGFVLDDDGEAVRFVDNQDVDVPPLAKNICLSKVLRFNDFTDRGCLGADRLRTFCSQAAREPRLEETVAEAVGFPRVQQECEEIGVAEFCAGGADGTEEVEFSKYRLQLRAFVAQGRQFAEKIVVLPDHCELLVSHRCLFIESTQLDVMKISQIASRLDIRGAFNLICAAENFAAVIVESIS
jgi:hypothetical protein